jgi:hypothetical protein
LYRILGVGRQPNDVRVDDDGISVPLEESLYRARGYWPLVDELPWRDDYLSQQASVMPPATEPLLGPAEAALGSSPLKPRGASIFRRYETR